MAASFTLTFTYDINYNSGDVLYFGMNLLLGCREFPLRFSGGAAPAAGGNDNSPRSSRTFNFTGGSQTITFNNSNIFDPTGLNDVTKTMLYNNPSNPADEAAFKTGSIALRQIVEFNPANGGSLNDFFDKQYTEVSGISLIVVIDTLTTTLVGKPASVKLGKQFGEILLLSWSSAV